MRICHFISGLGDGGAEATLYRLVAHSRDHRHLVVNLSSGGKYATALQNIGTEVVHLHLKSPSCFANAPAALRQIRSFGADVVQSWMYHANLVGSGIARSILRVPNAWGIRNSGIDHASARLRTRAAFALSRQGSRMLPDLKISCSERARRGLIAAGFDPHGWEVIPNGYDLAEFRFEACSRAAIRKGLDISDDDFLIGTVARWHPNKNHRILFAALHRIFEGGRRNTKVLLAGTGMTRDNACLQDMLSAHGLLDNVILMGPITNVAGLMSALDLHVLASAREGFPNVLCEAMACETPVICTDVGDAAEIIGQLGGVVRAGDVDDLVAKILDMIALRDNQQAWNGLRLAGRRRVEQSFSIDRMIRAYVSVWERLLSTGLTQNGEYYVSPGHTDTAYQTALADRFQPEITG